MKSSLDHVRLTYLCGQQIWTFICQLAFDQCFLFFTNVGFWTLVIVAWIEIDIVWENGYDADIDFCCSEHRDLSTWKIGSIFALGDNKSRCSTKYKVNICINTCVLNSCWKSLGISLNLKLLILEKYIVLNISLKESLKLNAKQASMDIRRIWQQFSSNLWSRVAFSFIYIYTLYIYV